MSKRLSDEQAISIMLAANFQPQESYQGAGKAWKCKCLICGNVSSPRLSTVQMGIGCAHCAGLAKITLEDATAIFNEANLNPTGSYKNSRTPWLAVCRVCASEVSPTVSYVKKHKSGCKPCSDKATGISRRIPENEAISILQQKGHRALEPFRGVNVPWKTIHEPCGRECAPRLAGLKSGESGCGYCAGKIRDESSAVTIMREAGFEPLEPYPGNKKYWKNRHLLCGNEVKTKFNTVQQGQGGCSFCSLTAKKSNEEATEFFISHGLKPLVDYESSSKPWLAIHIACGNNVAPSYASIQQGSGGCIYCAGNAPIKEEQARAIFESKELFPIGNYKNSATPWQSIHTPCGKKVSPTVSALRAGGGGCLYCGGALIDAEDALEIMKKNNFEPLTDYPGADSKWKSIHTVCGNEVSPRLTLIKRGDGGCRHCGGNMPIPDSEARALFLSKGFEPQELFKGSNHPWVSIHKHCGKTISPRYKAVKLGLAGCKYCSGNKIDPEDAVALFLSKGLKPLEPFSYTNLPWKSVHLDCGREVSPRYADVAHSNVVCKYCATKGFDLNKPGDLYLITHGDLGAHKVGIAGATTKRLEVHRRHGWEVWKVIRFPIGEQAYLVEQEVISWIREELILPPYLSSEVMPQGGWTETVDSEEIELNTLWKKILEVSIGRDGRVIS